VEETGVPRENHRSVESHFGRRGGGPSKNVRKSTFLDVMIIKFSE
jgi:hypothetical protein